jgi:hypothetical protein
MAGSTHHAGSFSANIQGRFWANSFNDLTAKSSYAAIKIASIISRSSASFLEARNYGQLPTVNGSPLDTILIAAVISRDRTWSLLDPE